MFYFRLINGEKRFNFENMLRPILLKLVNNENNDENY